jgi:CRP-like cAMP-binding protein
VKAGAGRKSSPSRQPARSQQSSAQGGLRMADLSRNRVLASLTAGELDSLRPHFKKIPLHVRQVLRRQKEHMTHLYFPTAGMISNVVVMANGFTVEVDIVGREGMLGASILHGYDGTPGTVSFVQVKGEAFRIRASDCQEIFDRKGGLQAIINRYIGSQWVQLAQSAACNRLHGQSQRFARWLLMTMDRVGPEFRMTHEFLAEMLGSRRATVSVEAQKLQDAGLIEYHRGTMRIRKRKGLELIACECYHRSDLDGFLGRSIENRSPRKARV